MKKVQTILLDIRIVAVVASLLISLFIGIFHSTPNDDAYVYIRTAEIFTNEGIGAAFAHYQWATFSILIGILHSTLGIELFTAAYLLNAVFYGLLVYSFISIVKEIDNSRQVMVLSAISILVYPQLNEFRHEIIRDIGFWSLSLFALWQFMLFQKTRDYGNAAKFCIPLLIAATFRAESMLYLFVIPFSLLFDTRIEKAQRIKYCLSFSGFSVLLLICITLVFSLAGLNLLQLFIDLFSVYIPFMINSLFPPEAERIEMGRILFNEYATFYNYDYVTMFLLAGLVGLLIGNLFIGIGGPFFTILSIGLFKRLLTIPKNNFLPLLAIILTNMAILFLFLTITRFVVSRYAMFLCLVGAMFVPLVLDRLIKWSATINRKKLVSGLIGFILLYCTIDAYISFGVNKNYIYDAADWVAQNSQPGTVITNSSAIAYFSGNVEDYDQITRLLTEEQVVESETGTLIAVESNIDMIQLFESPPISSSVTLINIFPSEEDPQLVVYRKL